MTTSGHKVITIGMAKSSLLAGMVIFTACGETSMNSRHAAVVEEQSEAELTSVQVSGIVESIGARETDAKSGAISMTYKIIKSNSNIFAAFDAVACLEKCGRRVAVTVVGTDIAAGSEVNINGAFLRQKGKDIAVMRMDNINSLVIDNEAPSQPGNLRSTAQTASSINLAWDASADNVGGSGLKGYNLYRGGTLLKTLSTSTLTYADTNLTADTSYNFQISAVDNNGNESTKGALDVKTMPAPVDTTAPSIPTGLAATAKSTSQIDLIWNASTDEAGGSGLKRYRIYRNNTMIKEVASTVLIYSDINLTASTSYSYSVAAVDNASNESSRSSAASAATLAPAPAPAPTISFKTNVVPALQKCTGCHSAMTTYAEAVNRSNLSASTFTLGHRNAFHSAAETKILQDWIAAGKPNN